MIHDDYKHDNLVLEPGDWRIRAALDWEVTTLGDPLMKVGTMLGYWGGGRRTIERNCARWCFV